MRRGMGDNLWRGQKEGSVEEEQLPSNSPVAAVTRTIESGERPNSHASALPGMADQQSSPGMDNFCAVPDMLQCVNGAAGRDTCGCILHASVGNSVGNGQGKQQK